MASLLYTIRKDMMGGPFFRSFFSWPILLEILAVHAWLVERLAERIADLCLDSPGVQRVRVRVDKPGALRFARSVAVEIDRFAADRS